ncbi:hypothetical protein [Paenibacillus sp. UNC217MF]|uniref:hypothetical protein n=1 Tax=Paenibacillus sp. UNC217MF TaxID=1449062 RepID=UPI000AC94491
MKYREEFLVLFRKVVQLESSRFLATWLWVQRWLMASVLTGLAASLAFDRR